MFSLKHHYKNLTGSRLCGIFLVLFFFGGIFISPPVQASSGVVSWFANKSPDFICTPPVPLPGSGNACAGKPGSICIPTTIIFPPIGICSPANVTVEQPPKFVGVDECKTSVDCQLKKDEGGQSALNGRTQCIKNPLTGYKICVADNAFVTAGVQHECDGKIENLNEMNRCDGIKWTEGKTYQDKPGTICARYYFDDANNYWNKCIYYDQFPAKPVLCTTNTDCGSQKPYCITNPKSGLRECVPTDVAIGDFSTDVYGCDDYQKNFQTCNGIKGNTTENADWADSMCTQYFRSTDGWSPKCVHMNKLVGLTKEGNALVGQGAAGEQTTNAVAANVEIAAERTERFAPRLEINIPGLSFTNTIPGEQVETGTNFTIPFLAQYVNAVYKYTIGVGVLLTVLMLIIGGFRWMTSLGNAAGISQARGMIANAALGLVLFLGVYLILYVINPDLVQLKSLTIFSPQQNIYKFEVESDRPNETDGDGSPISVSGSGPVNPGGKTPKICDTAESCAPYCSGKTANAAAVDAKVKELGLALDKDFVDVPEVIGKSFEKYQPDCQPQGSDWMKKFRKCGLVFRGKRAEAQLLAPVADGLALAATNAKKMGFVLSVGSMARSPLRQMEMMCTAIATGKQDTGGKPCGANLACPFRSPHGVGYAVDLCLVKPDSTGNCLTTPTDNKAPSCDERLAMEHSSPNATFYQKLNKIMFDSGWWKYCKEHWHFEYTGKARDSSRTKDSKWTVP